MRWSNCSDALLENALRPGNILRFQAGMFPADVWLLLAALRHLRSVDCWRVVGNPGRPPMRGVRVVESPINASRSPLSHRCCEFYFLLAAALTSASNLSAAPLWTNACTRMSGGSTFFP